MFHYINPFAPPEPPRLVTKEHIQIQQATINKTEIPIENGNAILIKIKFVSLFDSR